MAELASWQAGTALAPKLKQKAFGRIGEANTIGFIAFWANWGARIDLSSYFSFSIFAIATICLSNLILVFAVLGLVESTRCPPRLIASLIDEAASIAALSPNGAILKSPMFRKYVR